MRNSIYLLLAFLLFSCSGAPKEESYSLVDSGKGLSFPLDRNTRNFIIALFPYTDKDGKEYLTFQNFSQNEILFYDMDSRKLEFKIKPPYEGPNGVGEILGYHIHNLDSIFLPITFEKRFAVIDSSSKVIDMIQYEKTEDNIPLQRSYSTSATYHPFEKIGNKLYFVTGCSRWVDLRPITAYIDLTDNSVHAYTNFCYPSFPGMDNKAKRASVEDEMSRCFDGENFVYAFHFLENIQIASIDHQTIREVNAKSKYIDKIKLLDDYGNLTPNDACENPNYGNLIYDKYRNVYYRIAYPATEVDKSIKGMELLQYGRKNFSIIILNKDFEIVGETLFPDYTYNSTLMFINKDGLYISDSHYLNPEFSDDILSFRLFMLEN